MRNGFLLTGIALLAVFVAVGVTASDEHVEKQRKIKVLANIGDEATVIDVENDLALGETREILTEEGKTILVTRSNDDEITVTVDGKEIVAPGGGFHHETHGEGDGPHRVMVRHLEKHSDHECDEDCDHGEGHTVVKKVIVLGDDSEEVDVDVDVVQLGSAEWIANCEEDEEGCEAKILELLGDEEGEKNIVIIKKIVRSENEE